MTWRDRMRPLIAQVIEEHAGEPENAIKAALAAAYPCGEKKNYVYKVWLDEIKRQLGALPALGTRVKYRCDKTRDMFT